MSSPTLHNSPKDSTESRTLWSGPFLSGVLHTTLTTIIVQEKGKINCVYYQFSLPAGNDYEGHIETSLTIEDLPSKEVVAKEIESILQSIIAGYTRISELEKHYAISTGALLQ